MVPYDVKSPFGDPVIPRQGPSVLRREDIIIRLVAHGSTGSPVPGGGSNAEAPSLQRTQTWRALGTGSAEDRVGPRIDMEVAGKINLRSYRIEPRPLSP
jgi:hypothetical protein